MKTPKRAYKQGVCPECRSVVHQYSEEVDNGTGYETVDAYGECCNEDCNFSVKGLRDHDGWEDHQQEARWKRKNREARLKHALHKKDEIIDYAANEVQRMTNEARDEYEHQLRLRLSLAATRTLNNFQRGFINASGTYGQDIEGS